MEWYTLAASNNCYSAYIYTLCYSVYDLAEIDHEPRLHSFRHFIPQTRNTRAIEDIIVKHLYPPTPPSPACSHNQPYHSVHREHRTPGAIAKEWLPKLKSLTLLLTSGCVPATISFPRTSFSVNQSSCIHTYIYTYYSAKVPFP